MRDDRVFALDEDRAVKPALWVQPDHLTVLTHSGRHLIRASAEPDEVCSKPMYREDEVAALQRENEALRKQRRSDIDLSISFLSQVYGLIEEGKIDEASDVCRYAAKTWTQDIAELDAAIDAAREQRK